MQIGWLTGGENAVSKTVREIKLYCMRSSTLAGE